MPEQPEIGEGDLLCPTCNGRRTEDDVRDRRCCLDCREGKGTLGLLDTHFRTGSAGADSFPEWPAIKHFACKLFSVAAFDAGVLSRLEDWLQAEGHKSREQMLAMQTSEVATILRAACAPTSSIEAKGPVTYRADQAFGTPTDADGRLLVNRGSDLPQHILNRLQDGDPIVTAEEVVRWPDGILDQLLADGALQPAENAKSVACDACGHDHVEPVVYIESPAKSKFRTYIACPTEGRVAVSVERLKQWYINKQRLVEMGLRQRLLPELKSLRSPSSPSPVDPQEPRKPQPFCGGTIVFYQDRVEFCGVDICSGPRSQTRRRILDLLRRKRSDGRFVAYSCAELAAELSPKGSEGTVVGAIRDLRNDIVEWLRNKASLRCKRDDVILSKGPGYRFADCVSVHDGDLPETTRITDMGSEGDVPNVRNVPNGDVPNGDVPNVPDDAAGARRVWILQRLAAEQQLRAPDVAGQFKRSVKTAQRDLQALKEEGRIEFFGATRTGYYRLRKPPEPGR